MTNKIAHTIIPSLLLVFGSCYANIAEEQKSLVVDTNSSETIKLPIVYEVQTASRQSDDGRLYFDRFHHDIQGIHLTVGAKNYSKRDRDKSETGAILTFTETKEFITLGSTRLYVPNADVHSWIEPGIQCQRQEEKNGRSRITCVWLKTGATYLSMYSPLRGFEWFDAPCGFYSMERTCRYVLKTESGILSQRMIAELRRRKSIERR